MDPDQLEIVLVYVVLVSIASIALGSAKPAWSRTRIALIAGGLLPFLGLGFAIVTLVRWINFARPPGDIDQHAMAIVGILLLFILSFSGLVAGLIVSFLVTTIVRWRQADGGGEAPPANPQQAERGSDRERADP